MNGPGTSELIPAIINSCLSHEVFPSWQGQKCRGSLMSELLWSGDLCGSAFLSTTISYGHQAFLLILYFQELHLSCRSL